MKIFNLVTFVLLSLVFVGCTPKVCPPPEVITKIVIEKELVPVKQPRPVIDCEFSGTGNVPITKAIDCIILQKRIIESLTVAP